MQINLINNCKIKTWFYLSDIQKLINKVLPLFKSDKKELTLVIDNNKEVQKLNKEFRNQNKPTNVLSFETKDQNYLGDIIISIDKIRSEAKKQGKKTDDHFIHLLIHGILHLQGLDHIKDKDANKMEQKEIELLKKLNIKNPYKD